MRLLFTFCEDPEEYDVSLCERPDAEAPRILRDGRIIKEVIETLDLIDEEPSHRALKAFLEADEENGIEALRRIFMIGRHTAHSGR